MNLVQSRPPAVGLAQNPLLGLRSSDMRTLPLGTRVRDTLPEVVFDLTPDGEVVPTGGPMLCRLNGEWIARRDWGYELEPGDIVVWHQVPQSGESLRFVVGSAIAIVSAISGFTPGIQFGLAIVASSLLTALLTPEQRAVQTQSAGSVFTTSLRGNQARLNQAIWKVCGRRKITPPFAAMPYQEWIGSTDARQYFNAVFAVSIGAVDLEDALIGGTRIGHLQDVVTSALLAPGVAPSSASAAIETSTIVTSQILDTGKYVGGFVACKAERTCTHIGIDITATRGITLLMTWRVYVRSVNDFGAPTSGWTLVADESKTGTTNTPQNWSFKYTLAAAIRPEVRLVRTDLKSTDAAQLHELAWTGLRGYLAQSADLDADTTHYEVVLRASAQLNQYSQTDFALVVHGKCRTWDPDTGWGAVVYTRNPAWWALDLATSTTWGLGLDDDRVDLQSFADLADTCDARQDHFDYCFDTALSSWDALQLIARTARARVFRRNGVLTIARDELETIPVTGFSARNTVPGTITIAESLPQREQPDGVIIEYEDLRTWQWTALECPCPDVVDMVNPVRMRIEGVVGPNHAKREGLFEAARLLFRTRQVALRTEMEGIFPTFMSPIAVQPDIVGYGQSGDVVDWDDATLTLTLSEPPDWAAGDDLYLRLRRDDGSLTTPVQVTAGTGSTEVVLAVAPDFDLVVDAANRERPMYLLGSLSRREELCKVTAVADGGQGDEGEQLYDVQAIIDDARVHSADNAYLPGPGDIQDPIDTTEDTEGSGLISLAVLTGHTIEDGGSTTSSGTAASITLDNTGSLSWSTGGSGSGSFDGQWNLVTIAPAQAASAEVRFTVLDPTMIPISDAHFPHVSGSLLSVGGAAVGSWLNLGTARTQSIDNLLTPSDSNMVSVGLLVEIRDAASLIVQASAEIFLVVWVSPEDLGGGR
jgi:hypothetical protein